MPQSTRRSFLKKAGGAAVSAVPLAPSRRKERLLHHVLFYLNDPDNARDEARLIEGLETLARLPTVEFAHIGRPALTGSKGVEKNYSVSFLCCFKNLIEEEIFRTDPVHDNFLEEYAPLWKKREVFDALGKKV